MERTSTLLAHCGAIITPAADLDRIPVPQRTLTWTPVGHHEVRDSIMGELDRRGLNLTSETWALSKPHRFRKGEAPQDGVYYGVGCVAFGLMTVGTGVGGREMAIGIRNSMDKSFALGLAVGSRVFICDNLILAGEQVLYRRHTSGLQLAHETNRAMDTGLNQYQTHERFITSLENTGVDNRNADRVLVEAVRQGVVKGNEMSIIADAWFDNKAPKVGFDDFASRLGSGVYAERTAFNLHGLFTDTVLKRLNPNSRNGLVERSDTLNGIFRKAVSLATVN